MEKLAVFIFCAMISKYGVCQNMNYISFDSLLRNQANLLPAKYKETLNTLLLNKQNKSLTKRIDSIQFDYLILEETFCFYNSKLSIKELCYSKSDSLAKQVFYNGSKFPDSNADQTSVLIIYRTDLVKKLVFDEEWNSLLNNSLFEKLQYSEIQYFYGGCGRNATKKNVKRVASYRGKEIKSTYKIHILIDRTKNETKISFQIPPKKPKFTMTNLGFL